MADAEKRSHSSAVPLTPLPHMRLNVAACAFMVAVLSAGTIPESADAQQAIVINNPAPNPNAPSFRVSAQPILKYGGLNSDPRYELLGTYAAVYTNGRLYVAANAAPGGGSSYEIRVIDTAGRFVRQIGRAGDGPGEFRWISDIALLPNGSLAVVDVTRANITIVDTLGRVAATMAYAGRSTCCFSDGSYLEHPNPSTMRPAPGAARSTLALTLKPQSPSPAAGRLILTLDWSDTSMRIGPFQRTMRDGSSAPTFSIPRVPFSRTAMMGVTGAVIVHATADTYEYNVYSKDGSLLRTVRAALPPTPVTQADIAEARASLMQVATTPEMQRGFGDALDKVQMPATMPAFSAMQVDANGSVWLRSYSRTTPANYWWAKFDPAGKLLGTLRIPPDRGVLRFAGDHVILSQRDTATQTLVLYVHRIETVRPPDVLRAFVAHQRSAGGGSRAKHKRTG